MLELVFEAFFTFVEIRHDSVVLPVADLP